jgi:CRP-like cAMP-binding protein
VADTDKSELLGQIEFFKGCTRRQLDDIAKVVGDKHLSPGDILCEQGAFEHDVFVLVDGDAAVKVDGAKVAVVGTGEVVGELAMLNGGHRTATLEAMTPLHVLVLDPREVDSVLSADPSSAQRLGPRKHDA